MIVRAVALLVLATPAVAGPPSHCGERETVVFTCPVKQKTLSVCAGAPAGDVTYAQYRFGPIGKPELVHPPQAQGFSAFRMQESTLVSGTATTLSFANGEIGYEVWSQDGADGGVNIYKGSTRIATVSCTATATTGWDVIRESVAAGGLAELNAPATCDDAASRYADHAFAKAAGQMDGVQQYEIHEATKGQCGAGWSAEAVTCFAKSADSSACMDKLTAAQRGALDGAVRAITAGE